jgi:hypothetical protein
MATDTCPQCGAQIEGDECNSPTCRLIREGIGIANDLERFERDGIDGLLDDIDSLLDDGSFGDQYAPTNS